MNTTQEIFLQYYTEWLKSALTNKVTYNERIKDARTRSELLESIRYQTRNGRVSVDIPEKVKLFSREILRGYPTVTYGGPRYLHTAREDAMHQYEALKTMQIE